MASHVKGVRVSFYLIFFYFYFHHPKVCRKLETTRNQSPVRVSDIDFTVILYLVRCKIGCCLLTKCVFSVRNIGLTAHVVFTISQVYETSFGIPTWFDTHRADIILICRKNQRGVGKIKTCTTLKKKKNYDNSSSTI